MRLQECFLVRGIIGIGMMLGNFVGFDVAAIESLPGVRGLLGITVMAFFIMTGTFFGAPVIAQKMLCAREAI